MFASLAGPPTFHQIPVRMLIGAAMGAISAKIAGSSIRLWAQTSVIISIADSIFYLALIQGTEKLVGKKITYLCIHAVMSVIEVVALRKQNLIATIGTFVVSAINVSVCVSFFYSIQEESQDIYNIQDKPQYNGSPNVESLIQKSISKEKSS